MKRYHTDVLVVGGGGAATAATIAAHEAGARTMLAVKGRFGVPGQRGAGATSNPLADFWTIRTVGPEGSFFNPPDAVYGDMIQSGLGMADPELCRVFVSEVSDAVKRLRTMGMQFQSKMLATMEANPDAGKTNSIVAIQKAIIAQTGTDVLEHANLTDLVVEGGGCTGAVGVDDDGEPFLVEAGAVVLATGGVGQLFQYSFNPPGNTGDGYAMALRAGAELFNMEFMQQGLATTWPTQAMVMLYEMREPYRILNAHGKTFIGEYLPSGVTLEEVSRLKAFHWPVSCRDAALHLDRAIKGEVLAGRATAHDGVFLDLSGAERGFQPELFIKFLESRGIDIRRDLLQVQLHHHTSNGGIRIDALNHTVELPPGVGFDPGGIGKGLAADMVVEELMATGAEGACINVARDKKVRDRRPALCGALGHQTADGRHQRWGQTPVTIRLKVAKIARPLGPTRRRTWPCAITRAGASALALRPTWGSNVAPSRRPWPTTRTTSSRLV